MSKKIREDSDKNLLDVVEYAKTIDVTPERIEINSKYIDDNNGGKIIL